MCFTNDEWNKFEVPDTIIYKNRIRVGNCPFKSVLEKRKIGGTSGIAGVFVRDFWAAVDSVEVQDFLNRLKSRGHRLLARLGEEMLLGESAKQKSFSLISSWEKLQWQQALESRQPQTRLIGNVISWNLGPIFLSDEKLKSCLFRIETVDTQRGGGFGG